MDTFGIFGFMFGLMAFAMAAGNQRQVAALKKEIETLKRGLQRSSGDKGSV